MLVHGFLGGPSSMRPLQKMLQQIGIPTATWSYDWAAGAGAGGDSLRQQLLAMHRETPRRRIAIVAHSLGGLVSRCAIEQPMELSNAPGGIPLQERQGSALAPYPACGVSHLIMIATPNHGSSLAGLSIGDSLRTFGVPTSLDTPYQYPRHDIPVPIDDQHRFDPRRAAPIDSNRIHSNRNIPNNDTGHGTGIDAVLDESIDGALGIARVDLRPDSPFLRALNARSRAPGVRYTILAGDAGPVPPIAGQIGGLVSTLLGGENPAANRRVDEIARFASRSEWTKGTGDGVVSVQSTRLSGVTDHRVLSFRHNQYASTEGEQAPGPKILQEILKRIGISPH
ncbi:MAG: hypothetical protein AAFP90_13660 [Planctomycetota bacterium]